MPNITRYSIITGYTYLLVHKNKSFYLSTYPVKHVGPGFSAGVTLTMVLATVFVEAAATELVDCVEVDDSIVEKEDSNVGISMALDADLTVGVGFIGTLDVLSGAGCDFIVELIVDSDAEITFIEVVDEVSKDDATFDLVLDEGFSSGVRFSIVLDSNAIVGAGINELLGANSGEFWESAKVL